jgi:hypothetical protein
MDIVLTARSDQQREIASACWTGLSNSIELPVQRGKWCVRAGPRIPDHPGLLAKAVLQVAVPVADMPETGFVHLFDDFFKENKERRKLILLHELIHLRLLSGRLNANLQAMNEMYFDIDQREDLANVLGNCVQEIGCDKFAHANYKALQPEYFTMRRHYYVKPDAYLQYKGDDATPALHRFVTLYRLIRAEAGVGFYQNDAELSDLREKYRTELRSECGTDINLYDTLQAAMQKLLDVDVETDEPAQNKYMALFHLVANVSL